MKIEKFFALAALGFFAQGAMAAVYTYTGPDIKVKDSFGDWYSFVGSFAVADGPPSGKNPPSYSAIEAANLPTVFGPLTDGSNYAVSIFSPFYDPVVKNQPAFDVVVNPVTRAISGTGMPITGVISSNAIISHTGWYDYYGMVPHWPLNALDPTKYDYLALPAPGTGQVYMPPNGMHPFSIYVNPENYKLDQPPVGYITPNVFTYTTLTQGAISAYVNDHFNKNAYVKAYFTNYVWKHTPTPPIPEPETYALMLAGLGMVITIARRRMSA